MILSPGNGSGVSCLCQADFSMFKKTHRARCLPLNSIRSVFGPSPIRHGSRANRFNSSRCVNFHWLSCVAFLLRCRSGSPDPSEADRLGYQEVLHHINTPTPISKKRRVQALFELLCCPTPAVRQCCAVLHLKHSWWTEHGAKP